MTIQFLTDATTRLSLDQRYADLELHCGGQTFKVHRAVVCSASAVMATECDGGDKHDGITVVSLDHISAKSMNSMLQFMYHGTYSLDEAVTISTARQSEVSANKPWTASEKIEEGSSKDILLAHAQVGNLAASYQLPELEILAQERFGAARRKGIVLDPEDMIELASEVYTQALSGTDGLRAVILEMILEHADKYLNDCGFIDCIMKDEGLQDLAMDILASVAIRHTEQSGEVQACQHEILALKKAADVARTATSSVDSELQKKEKVHDTTMKQLESDIKRLESEMAAKEKASNALLKEETTTIKREYEERIMRIKQQSKDQDRLRCDQITDAAKKLTQANGSLASTKTELKALRTAHAVSEAKVSDLQEQVRNGEESLSEAMRRDSRNKAMVQEALTRMKERDKAEDRKSREEIANVYSSLAKANADLAIAHAQIDTLKSAQAAAKLQAMTSEQTIYQLRQQATNWNQALAVVAAPPNLDLWRARVSELEDEVALQKAVVNQIIDINAIRRCRNRQQCRSHDFYYNLERDPEAPNGYQARCVYCRTRHWAKNNVIL
ncbi:unnamed protein product [Zymoseptoria tritici ST99CH_1E4]|uniref:BTB domain-containing protein n=1 Tax=Zymoseptoria tritici ST99CH_1E4 TaxID=1276532 RepID=A0A2H1H083_ZYMTR|nr:unnamed protein product [Zymoseptoria tritici ST99CH_1E4]